MPRRNFRWLIAVALLSGLCYACVPGSRYSRMLAGNLDRVARRYYRPVDELELFEESMGGMMRPLDEHSVYIKAAKREQFENDLNQEFVGIGILQALDPKSKQLLVLSPLPDGPAFAAGVRAGDRILKIDGQSTQGMSLKDTHALIVGKADTPVTITVQHTGSAQPIDLSIVRRVVHEETVEGASRGPDGRWKFLLPAKPSIGYIAINAFADADGGEKNTAGDFRAAMDQLGRENARGLILDLRDDRGGSLQAAIDICDMLVAHGQIVTTRGRDHQILHAYRASGRAAFTEIPIAVLVNGSTASASEIVAACLQDNGRAIVVGQRTYGKGTVQQVFGLGEPFGAVKLTIATYWRPSGQDINRPQDDGANLPWGVTPNEGYELLVTDEEREKLLKWQQDHELAALTGAAPPAEVPDRVLQKAVECLEAKAH